MGDLSRINTNVAALRALQHLNVINDKILKSSEQLATGKTINRASDNPSQYFAARKLAAEIATGSIDVFA